VRAVFIHLFFALICWGAHLHSHAEELDLASLVKLAKQAKAKELADSMNREIVAVSPTPIPLPNAAGQSKKSQPSPPPAPPVLKYLYGFNDRLQADVVYNGKAITLSNDSRSANLGSWAHHYIFTEGVLLTLVPLAFSAAEHARTELLGNMSRQPVCQLLGMSDKQCLFLVPSQALVEEEISNTGKAAIFQDQVRTLVHQVPPMNYSASTGPSSQEGVTSHSQRSAVSEPVARKTGVFPK
jgi:hypothetical protein